MNERESIDKESIYGLVVDILIRYKLISDAMIADAQDFSWHEVGARIRDLRLARGISQAQLAKGAGLSAPGMFAIEVGGVNPQLSSLRSIAKVLGCSVRTLVTGKQDAPTEEVRQILERVRRLLESGSANAISALLSGIDAGYLMLHTKAEIMDELYSYRLSVQALKRWEVLTKNSRKGAARSSKKPGRN